MGVAVADRGDLAVDDGTGVTSVSVNVNMVGIPCPFAPTIWPAPLAFSPRRMVTVKGPMQLRQASRHGCRERGSSKILSAADGRWI